MTEIITSDINTAALPPDFHPQMVVTEASLKLLHFQLKTRINRIRPTFCSTKAMVSLGPDGVFKRMWHACAHVTNTDVIQFSSEDPEEAIRVVVAAWEERVAFDDFRKQRAARVG